MHDIILLVNFNQTLNNLYHGNKKSESVAASPEVGVN